jgi:hypothetical protein
MSATEVESVAISTRSLLSATRFSIRVAMLRAARYQSDATNKITPYLSSEILSAQPVIAESRSPLFSPNGPADLELTLGKIQKP